MSDPYLAACDVSKSYGSFTAVRGASLEVMPAEIVALLGPNGAGKTTFIKILATLLIKNGGKVEILGYDLDRSPEEIRHLIGYVGQDTERSAYARLTVVSARQIESQIEKLAGIFAFQSNLDKQFVTLSGGQKQTVVIMRAFLHDPPLVYLDEPTKGLDPIIARRIRTFLKHVVVEEGKSLLLTSHILTEVDEMADRVALIQEGQIQITGRPNSLKSAVGADHFIELHKNGLPDATLRRILDLPAVLFEMERDADWISFGVRDTLAGAEAIIKVLRQEGVEVGFRYHAISLEDAFLHHIGELTEKFD